MLRFSFLVGMTVFCTGLMAQTQPLQNVESKIDRVTVFLKGAQVTRTKTLTLQTGATTLAFNGLSQYLDPSTVQVRLRGQAQVIGVKHRFDYADSVANDRKNSELDQRIQELSRQINALVAIQAGLAEEIKFLNDNRTMAGKESALSLASLKESGAYFRDRTTAIRLKISENQERNQEILQKRNLLIQQRNESNLNYQQRRTRTVEVMVNATRPTTVTAEITYALADAGWYPSYDIRAEGTDRPVQMVYRANIYQRSGEAWNQVKIKLSTGNPSAGNIAPKLTPYALNYGTRPPRYSEEILTRVTGHVYTEDQKPIVGASVRIQGSSLATVTDSDGRYSLALNRLGAMLEFSASGRESQSVVADRATIDVTLNNLNKIQPKNKMRGMASQDEMVLQTVDYGVSAGALADESVENSMVQQIEQTPTDVEFEINQPYSVAADGKTVNLEIKTFNVPTEYLYSCTPKIQRDVYLTANLTEWRSLNLLEGEANIFFENSFVGKTILAPTAESDTLAVSLGRDRNVTVQRENRVTGATTRFIGSRTQQLREWVLTVRSVKKEPIRLKLYEQIPVSTNPEIEVAVDQFSGASIDKTTGIVVWTLDLKPNVPQERQLKYMVKYPKNRSVIID